ncbi:hypothetical protein CQZ91_04560 [Bacillus cereus]|uniref:hypothetical protein n=1 Tax=Bacillus cereus group TaxID=86661 RepID=UPI000995CD8F|nr:hypothetical protein [Bacillus cereus]OOZ94932.1 hypothetical protein BHL51_24860 [Bacillus cereus]PRD00844.1 hypothetical protein CQZ92_04560 [Bacillus cereus]PRD06528.1 hypothetical protein CQZ91_04560 [Bacillus cereus]
MNKEQNVLKTEKSCFERTIVSIYKALEFIMKYTMILIIIMSIFVIIAAVYFKIYEGIGAGVFLLISSLFAYVVFFKKSKNA